MEAGQLIQNTQTPSRLTLIWLHCRRILKRWQANPSLIVMSVIYPIVSMILMKLLFSGMIELLTGKPMDLAHFSLVIGVMSMFTGAITGAGTIVAERKQGIVSRFASLPGPSYVSEAGRVMAESIRALLTALVTLVVALIFGAVFADIGHFIRTLLVLVCIALSVGFVAVMLGYASETPQGAVALAPLIMIFSFFNTAFMPLDKYAPAFRGLARYSPFSIVTDLVRQPDLPVFLLGLAYFLGLILLSVTIIHNKVKKMRA